MRYQNRDGRLEDTGRCGCANNGCAACSRTVAPPSRETAVCPESVEGTLCALPGDHEGPCRPIGYAGHVYIDARGGA